MALFNLIAKRQGKVDWVNVHSQIFEKKGNFICLFPIPSNIDERFNSIGITASGEFKNMLFEVKRELLIILEILWENGFLIIDLYKGEVMEFKSYSKVLNYL